MVKETRNRNGRCSIVLMLLILVRLLELAAQEPDSLATSQEADSTVLLQPDSTGVAEEPDLFAIEDTSYFRSGEDDWNLVESVIRGDHANVLMLLKRGADPNARAEGGLTALMYAAEKGDLWMIKLLVLNGAKLELTFVENTTPLLVSVLNQHFESVHYLLEKGADPNHVDKYGGSPLIYAAALNDYAIADLLLFFGASDTIRDREGNDAVMTGTYFGNIETVDVLLQNNLDPDGSDRKGNTPLMIAAQQGNRDILILLLEYGAELDRVNRQNYTALAHAIRYHHPEIAEILIDSGANVHHLITPNRNLYDLAVRENQKKIQDLLKAKGAGALTRPDFSEIDVGWGNSFLNGEHMMQNRVSWVDTKFGFFAETGFDFRPYPRTVQTETADTLIFQYRENRPAWVHGFGKYFRIAQDHTGIEYGVYGGLYGLLSFPKYRGFEQKPSVKYTLMPSAGIYMQGKIGGIKWGVERYDYGTLKEGKWKMNITLFIRISYRRISNVKKEIYY